MSDLVNFQIPVTAYNLGLDLMVGEENAEFIFEDHFGAYFWFRSIVALSQEAFGAALILWSIY